MDPSSKIVETGQQSFVCPHCNIVTLHLLLEPFAKRGISYNDIELAKELANPNNPGHPLRTVEVTLPKRHLIYKCVKCNKDTYVLIQEEGFVQLTGAFQ